MKREFVASPPEHDSSSDSQWALADAHIPSLLAALAYLTGDRSLIDDKLRPSPLVGGLVPPPQGGLTTEQLKEAESRCSRALSRLNMGGPSGERPIEIAEIIEFLAGGPISDAERSLLEFELALPDDKGRPGWHYDDFAGQQDMSVVIVGAGMSGIVLGIRLLQAGVPFTILERNDDVGGVWLENDYPGCRLDTNNFTYSYSFAQRDDWKQQFATRGEILAYFRSVADRFGVRERIQFNCSVTAASFDEASAQWSITYRNYASNTEETASARILVSAVGQLNNPSIPEIPGIETFAGESWHTARWSSDADLVGARVAIVGTGASAYQVVPAIYEQVRHLTVVQRNPPWMVPTPDYEEDLPGGLRQLFRSVPNYNRWFRLYQFYAGVEGRHRFAVADPAWTLPGSVSEENESLRRELTKYIERQFETRPDLQDQVVPKYPPYSKRMLRDNGSWARALLAPHVALVTGGIRSISESGLVLTSGQSINVDKIIWATGFRASEFLRSIDVRGRGGCSLHENWAGDARAYLGMTVPRFPNLFMMYGPNANLVVNGSLVLFSECSANYIVDAIHELLRSGRRSLEVRPEPFMEFNQLVDEGNARMAWGVSGVDNWYKNETGRVSQNWPFPVVDYWKATQSIDISHFIWT